MIRLVIFDLDETLLRLPVDWEGVKKDVIAYGNEEKLEFDENAHILPLSAAVSSTPDRKKEVDSIWRRHETETIEKKGVERYPEAEEFVKTLRAKGFLLAIASNNNHATIDLALEKAGMRNAFALIIGRDDVQNPKPAPDMLLKLAWKFKLEKSEIVFIGDGEGDRIAGAAAGIRTVLVKPGSVQYASF